MSDANTICHDVDLLGDWLDAKGYTEEAGLCTRAMDEINRLSERLAGYQKDADEYLIRVDELNALRAENDKLRAALKPFADAADYCPVDDDEPYNKRFLSGTLRAAKKAMRNC